MCYILCLNKKNRTSTNEKNFGHDNSTPHTNLLTMKKKKKDIKHKYTVEYIVKIIFDLEKCL